MDAANDSEMSTGTPPAEAKAKASALLHAITQFRELKGNLCISEAAFFLHAVANEGESLSKLQKISGVSAASSSRYAALLSDKGEGKVKPGHGFITATPNPLNRREKIVVTTLKGRRFFASLFRPV